jgi:formylglycine-generating enzyme required for sulfatase activity
LFAIASNAAAQLDRSLPGFTALAPNAHGRPEYRHEASGIVFIEVPAGSFMMGSPDAEERRFATEGPLHRVDVKSFLLARTEVTQAAWLRIIGTTPWRGQNYTRTGDRFPVTEIGFADVKSFCDKTGLRLPTEAEWEYACRAGARTRYHFGDDEAQLADYAWFRDNTWSVGKRCVQRVGLRKPNAWGFHDIHGNVWEWCEDHWHPSYDGAPTDGRAWSEPGSTVRVQRSGSYIFDPWNLRCASRIGNDESFRNDHLGFRPAFSHR